MGPNRFSRFEVQRTAQRQKLVIRNRLPRLRISAYSALVRLETLQSRMIPTVEEQDEEKITL